jgi:predicted tellurium resistance membrane protein TerC
MELLLDPAAWASLVTLTALEIVLGVDNIVVLALLTSSLPKREARRARSAGLGLALVLRLLLLSAISWMTRLTAPVFAAGGLEFSWRSLILMGGGLFLMVKAVQEIHAEIEGAEEDRLSAPGKARFSAVIMQIAIMDLIFSLDSIVTAVGLAQNIEVMAAAICIAIAMMYFAANVTGEFIERHPTLKMLALCFLILIGTVLVADGFGVHVPRVYIYFAMAFAGCVEALNIWAKTRANAMSNGTAAQSRTGQQARAGKSPGVPANLSTAQKNEMRLRAAAPGKRRGEKRSRRK